jgi:hypothetical protein
MKADLIAVILLAWKVGIEQQRCRVYSLIESPIGERDDILNSELSWP